MKGFTVKKEFYPAVEKQKEVISDLMSEYRKGLMAQVILFEAGEFEDLYKLYETTDEIHCDLCMETIRFSLLCEKLKLPDEIVAMREWFNDTIQSIRGEANESADRVCKQFELD